MNEQINKSIFVGYFCEQANIYLSFKEVFREYLFKVSVLKYVFSIYVRAMYAEDERLSGWSAHHCVDLM